MVLCALLLTSCIKLFDPVIESSDAVKFVVSGQVIKGEDIQQVNISVTSPISKPAYIPLTGCQVTIQDNMGNGYVATDQFDGNYNFYIPESNLTPGLAFMVNILTPGGINIVSDFDSLNDCPDVDTVYYVLKDVPTSDPEVFKKGLQFYVDLNGENSSSRFFRWEPEETWEYHSTWPIEWYYDGTVHHEFPADYSRMVCWKTEIEKNIYPLSTENLESNIYKALPLQFVDNYSTSKLVYGYSLLLRQFALSREAYSYWEKMRINNTEQGGLYDKQPLAIRGNLHNASNPDQAVLGFFGAAVMKTKRIFVSNVENLPIEYSPNCTPGPFMRGGFKEVSPEEYPFYLYGDKYGFSMSQLQTQCVDCLSVGGTNIKPSFWPY